MNIKISIIVSAILATISIIYGAYSKIMGNEFSVFYLVVGLLLSCLAIYLGFRSDKA